MMNLSRSQNTMLNESQIADIWIMFKEYIDKKQLDIVAEKYVDLLADYGVNDETLQETIGTDNYLDNAVNYYLETDYKDRDEDEDDEDY
jgi:hypothetical protein